MQKNVLGSVLDPGLALIFSGNANVSRALISLRSGILMKDSDLTTKRSRLTRIKSEKLVELSDLTMTTSEVTGKKFHGIVEL